MYRFIGRDLLEKMRAISPGGKPANWEVKACISGGNSPVKSSLSFVAGAGAVGAAGSTAMIPRRALPPRWATFFRS